MNLFKDLYRVESIRLPGWDYGAAGWYFVTICTKNRACFFGEVTGDEMGLSPIGEIVATEWERTAEVRPNIALDAWVVMPNHFHGIILIKDAALITVQAEGRNRQEAAIRELGHRSPETVPPPHPTETPHRGVSTGDVAVETPRLGVSGMGGGGVSRMDRPALSKCGVRGVSGPTGGKQRPHAGSLGAIIGQFKGVCTKRIREDGLGDFAWQPRFYDHIIRDEESLKRIQEYIANNPVRWALDKDNPENLFI